MYHQKNHKPAQHCRVASFLDQTDVGVNDAPILGAHADYTESFRDMICDESTTYAQPLAPTMEQAGITYADIRAASRIVSVQLWRNFGSPQVDYPLALCDTQTVDRSQFEKIRGQYLMIATVNTSLAYLPSHEAQHNIIAGKGKPLRWLNELVGHVSVVSLASSYRVLRATHMEHHAHTNNPELDVDYDFTARNGWDFLYKSVLNRQPGSKAMDAYPAPLERSGQSHLMVDALVIEAVYLIVLFLMAWTGHAIEAALLW